MTKSRLPKKIYIGAATRTPIGKFGGSLQSYTAPQLATLALQASLKVSPTDPQNINGIILGHARQAGAGPNPARQAGIFAGLADTIPAFTVNQACASGLRAVVSAAESIALGRAKTIFAGGVESMSNTPFFVPQARWGNKMGNLKIIDGMYQDGFHCPMADMVMGATVENYLVPEFKISREEQDDFALKSQIKASNAWKQGRFNEEVHEILPDGKKLGLKTDEHFRSDTTKESLQKLKPVFNTSSGTITAGNSSGITDGAAFCEISESENSASLVELLDWEISALDPRRMGIGPVSAINNLLKNNSLNVSDIDLFEINEAFAAQVIACQRHLNIPEPKLNVNGGSIALGHPIGATGVRILCTLAHELKRRGPNKLGVASLCVSGGMGFAILIRSL